MSYMKPMITSLGKSELPVYDIETEEHTFLGNGILLHNSCYINLFPLLKKLKANEKPLPEKVDFLDSVCKRITEKAIDPINKKMAEQMNFEPHSRDILKFDREAISVGKDPEGYCGFSIGKKHYQLIVADMEGLRYDLSEYPYGHIKNVGLEFKKISLPEFVRKELENICISFIVDGIDVVRDKLKKFKTIYFSKEPHEIGTPIGVSEIEKYTDPKTGLFWTGRWYDKETGTERNGGVPAQSKAAIRFNYLVKKLNLEKKYQKFTNGAKIYMVYLKENPYRFDTIGFHDRIPEEFELAQYVDYEKMWTKQVYKFLSDVTERCGVDIEKKRTLDEFF